MGRLIGLSAVIDCLVVVFAAIGATKPWRLGKRFVRELRVARKDNDRGSQENMCAKGFQTLLQNGGHNRDAVPKINADLRLDEYNWRNFKVSRRGPMIIAD